MYLKQKTDYDCSPIAICNALIWSGMKIWKVNALYVLIKGLCKTDKNGTYDNEANFALRTINKRYKNFKKIKHIQYINNESIKYILSALNNQNYCIILGHLEIWENNPEWHNSFWFKNGKYFIGINAHQKHLYYQVDRKYFKKILKKTNNGCVSSCWILQKK